MIVDAIFALLFGLLDALVSVFPSFTPPVVIEPHVHGPAGIGGFMWQGGQALQRMDEWIAVDTLVTVLAAMITAFIAYGAIVVGLWVYKMMPGKSS